MTEKTCSTCQCNKVCDHNKYGFENCGNYISSDVVPRAEVAREIFEEVEALIYSKCFSVRADRDVTGLIIDGERYAELKKKYTEEGK